MAPLQLVLVNRLRLWKLLMAQTDSRAKYTSSADPLPLIIKVRDCDSFLYVYFPLCFGKRLSEHLFFIGLKGQQNYLKLENRGVGRNQIMGGQTVNKKSPAGNNKVECDSFLIF